MRSSIERPETVTWVRAGQIPIRNINLQETLFGGPPYLITTQTSLPFVPLYFATTGTISMGVGISLSGGFANSFIATSFNPVQTVPEVSEGLTAVVV